MIVTVEEREKYTECKGFCKVFQYKRHVYENVNTIRIDMDKHVLKTYAFLEVGVNYEFSEPFYDTSCIKIQCDSPDGLVLLTVGNDQFMGEEFYIDTTTVRNSFSNRIIDYDKDISYHGKDLVFTFGKEKVSIEK